MSKLHFLATVLPVRDPTMKKIKKTVTGLSWGATRGSQKGSFYINAGDRGGGLGAADLGSRLRVPFE